MCGDPLQPIAQIDDSADGACRSATMTEFTAVVHA
jgi:hypothetical protein